MSAASSVLELMQQAERLPYGAEHLRLVQQAVRLADRQRRADLAFEARKMMVGSAVFSGVPEEAAVAVTWCLARCDQEPDRYREADLLWDYANLVGTLPRFPTISRGRILDLLSDLEQRLQRVGCGDSRAAFERWQTFWQLGDSDRAEKERVEFRTLRTRRDRYSICRACEIDADVEFLVDGERFEEALRLARPLIEGRIDCTEVPDRTLPRLLLPCLELGRAKDARRFNQNVYGSLSRNLKFLDEISYLILYRAMVRGSKDSLMLIERHGPWLSQTIAPSFDFWVNAYLALDTLRRRFPDQDLQVRVPADWFPSEGEGSATGPRLCHVVDLLPELERKARELNAAFDRRNGNTSVSHRFKRRRLLVQSLVETGG